MTTTPATSSTGSQPSARPPRLPGIPYLTDNLNMLNDPLRYLVRGYQKYGPVFRTRLGLIEYTILAGLEANLLLQRDGEQIFGSESLFGGMARQFNTDVMLTVLDGEDHRHMRKIMRPGFAKSSVAPHIGPVVGVVQEYAARWKSGDSVPVFDLMRRLVCDQIGLIGTGVRPGERYKDVLTFLQGAMNVEVLKVWPRALLRRESFKRAKANMLALGLEIVEHHRANPPEKTGRPRNLVDDILAGDRPDGSAFTEDDLMAMAVGPYIAGIDTLASTLSFFVYTVLKHPEVRARLEADAEALFADGTPDLNAFRKAESLHAAAIETLRLYSVTPFTPRTVTAPFEFGGFTLQPGTEVMIAQAVTHMLPEYYPNPEKFDIDRHINGPQVPVGAFAPYTLGAHTCLGAGMAEALMLINMAALLKFARLDLPSPDYVVPVRTMPLPNPGQKFAVKVR
ncbi:MAG: cytochrome P450 [Chloroflexi bacterium]|nr:cytochrome P450 [Chloroflexota bacterium]